LLLGDFDQGVRAGHGTEPAGIYNKEQVSGMIDQTDFKEY
jgi:hypothetical protein